MMVTQESICDRVNTGRSNREEQLRDHYAKYPSKLAIDEYQENLFVGETMKTSMNNLDKSYYCRMGIDVSPREIPYLAKTELQTSNAPIVTNYFDHYKGDSLDCLASLEETRKLYTALNVAQ